MYSIQNKGIKALLKHVYNTYECGDERQLREWFGEYREPNETDINDFLEWKLNQRIEDTFETFIPFIEYGPDKDWKIDDKQIDELTKYCNEILSEERKYEILAVKNNGKALRTEVELWIDNYLDSLCNYEFNWEHLKKYSSYD